jgi:hypothetical protein
MAELHSRRAVVPPPAIQSPPGLDPEHRQRPDARVDSICTDLRRWAAGEESISSWTATPEGIRAFRGR